jgi:hypothetical protein
MNSVYIKNLFNDASEDLIASDLIPQDLIYESKHDLFLKIKDQITGNTVISKFREIKSDKLYTVSNLKIKNDYFLTAELINIKNGNTYPITIYDENLMALGTFKMECEDSNLKVKGWYGEENGYLKTRLFISLE